MLNIQTPAARSGDPESSHAAADEVTKSGARQYQMALVVDLVHKTNGKTSRELAALHDQDRYMVARRLSEAETAGEVMKGDIRICEIGKRKAVTWWVKDRTHSFVSDRENYATQGDSASGNHMSV